MNLKNIGSKISIFKNIQYNLNKNKNNEFHRSNIKIQMDIPMKNGRLVEVTWQEELALFNKISEEQNLVSYKLTLRK